MGRASFHASVEYSLAMASAPVEIDEESLIREQIARIELPEGVRFKKIEPRAEWTGEPAWQITFAVSKKIRLTKEFLGELHRIRDSVQDAIFPLNLGKWPFVRFTEAA